jgi:hypothetical protein
MNSSVKVASPIFWTIAAEFVRHSLSLPYSSLDRTGLFAESLIVASENMTDRVIIRPIWTW